MRIDEVEMISMLIPASASASNMSAATPGLLRIPAPTSDTLPMSASQVCPWASTCFAITSSTGSAVCRSACGIVNEMSV